MTVIVTDASVVAPAIASSQSDGVRFRERLRGQAIAAPDLMKTEVLSVIRRRTRKEGLSVAEAATAVQNLLELPVMLYPTTPLLARAWQLRDNLTPYDACYVALAEALDCLLVTADSRLARAPGITCLVEVV